MLRSLVGKGLAKTKKVSITLPSGLFNALEQLAQKEGSKHTTLATGLLESLIREAIGKGRVNEEETVTFPLEEWEQVRLYFDLLAGLRDDRNGISFEEVAEILGRDVAIVYRLADLVRECRQQQQKSKESA